MDDSPSGGYTDSHRVLDGRAGALRQWSGIPRAERPARTQAARDGWLAKLEAEIDPDGRLDPDERRQLAVQRRRAHIDRDPGEAGEAVSVSAAEPQGLSHEVEDPAALLAALRMMLAAEKGDTEEIVGIMGLVDAERRFTALAALVKAAFAEAGLDYRAELRRRIREVAWRL